MSEERLHVLLETLKKQGLETGEALGREITEAARQEAEDILARARAEAASIVENVRREAELETRRLNSSLAVAASKFVNHLKLMIEENLLKVPLGEEIEGNLRQEDFIRKLIVDFVERFAAGNTGENFSVRLPQSTAMEIRKSISASLAKILEREGGNLVVDDPELKYGFVVEMRDGILRLDFSEEAFLELFLSYFSPEFRHYFDAFSDAAGKAS